MRHGSLQNLLAGSTTEPITVGMGATRIGWTDRHPYTVIEVRSPKCLVLREDKATRTDNLGMSDCQSYEFNPDPDGRTVVVTLRKNGKWGGKGRFKQGAPLRSWVAGSIPRLLFLNASHNHQRRLIR